MDVTYDGYDLRPAAGGSIRHCAALVDDGILLTVVSQDGELAQLFLTAGETRRLATTLLRDVGLLLEGSG